MFFFLASSQLFPAFIPSVDEGDRTRTRDRIVGGESERGSEKMYTNRSSWSRARAIEVMQMMIMTARHGAWREGGRGNGGERRDNDRGLIDTRRGDMD